MEIRNQNWSVELFDIRSDWGLALISFFIPFSCCIMQGLAVQEATLKNCCGHCLIGLAIGCGAGSNRSLIRQRYRIKGDYQTDCLISILCCFSSVQEYKEVNFREKRMRIVGLKNLKD